MSQFPYRTALIVGAGPGIGASVARALVGHGVKVGVAARDGTKLRPLAEAAGRAAVHGRRLRSGPGRAPVPGGRGRDRRTGGGALQRLGTAARRARRPGAERGARDAAGVGLRRLPGGPAGRPADAAAGPGRHPPDRRDREREGLCPILRLRHGQVRPAPAWPRAPRASWRPRAFMWRTSSSTAACAATAAPTPRTGPTAPWTPTPSPRPTSTSCASRAAPGAGRSSCGPGVETF
ncbi:MAG: hypothetical protein WDN45_15920 [Caulobacteraceae bacterium]